MTSLINLISELGHRRLILGSLILVGALVSVLYVVG